MPSVPGSWCPIRVPQIPGAKVPCDNTCAFFIPTTKVPPTHSCAITIMGIYALQRIVVPKQEKSEGAGKAQPEGKGQEAQ